MRSKFRGGPQILLLIVLGAVICLSGLTGSLSAGPVAWEDQSTASGGWREDMNGDGRVSLADVVACLLIRAHDPTDPRGDYDRDGRATLTDIVALTRNVASGNLHPMSSPVDGNWQVLGPGGGGSLYIPTIDPFDSRHAFARCDMSGAYVTADGGQSWRMFNLRTVVNDFEFDPNVPGTVYAASTGLYRSVDNGARWSLIYPAPGDVLAERMVGDHAEQGFATRSGKPGRPIEQVLVDPADSRRIFLALPTLQITSLANPPVRAGSDVLIVVSEDGGATWRDLGTVGGKEIRALFPGSWWGRPREVTVVTETSLARVDAVSGGVTSLSLPDSPVLAADGGKSAAGAALYVLAGVRKSGSSLLGGVFVSADGGTSWQTRNTDLFKGFGATGRAPDFSSLAVCRSDPATVYLAAANYSDAANSGTFGIWKTADSGTTWNWALQMSDAAVLTKNFSESWIVRNYDQTWPGSPFSLGVCPTDPSVCYATDYARVYLTDDAGHAWRQAYSRDNADGSNTSRGLDVTTAYGVHFDPFDSLHVFFSYTDIGLSHSLDGGKGWQQSRAGITDAWINTCYWMEFDPAVQGLAWSVWASCHDLPRFKMLRSGNIETGKYSGGVAQTSDSGRSWNMNYGGIPASAVCTHVLLDPSSPVGKRVLYVCAFGRGVYKSTDNGDTWSLASSGISGNLNAWRMTRLPDGTLYLLVTRGLKSGQPVDGALYKSTDGAGHWSRATLPAGVVFPNDLICDPADPRRRYLSAWPRTDQGVSPPVERNGGLYLTEDGGTSWRQLFDESAHVYAAGLDPADLSHVVINTFDSGAFGSHDRGATWRKLAGYSFKWGQRPVFDPRHPGMLYLTTFGGSVFYGPSDGVTGAAGEIENLQDSWRWPE